MTDEGAVDEAFATMARLKVDMVLIGVDPTFGFSLRDQIEPGSPEAAFLADFLRPRDWLAASPT